MKSNAVHNSRSGNRNVDNRTRKGAVSVETAIVLPILIYLFLGAVDIGQYVDLSQTVTNASRNGARLAARDSTTTVGEVKRSVAEYLRERFPDGLSESLTEAVTIEIFNDRGCIIDGDDLTSVASGDQFSVKVSFEYSAVRWIKALGFLLQDEFVVTTAGRRE